MPSMSSRDLIKALQAGGWMHVRTVGSHHHFRHPNKPGTITVPHPRKDLKKGTLRAILKAAGLE